MDKQELLRLKDQIDDTERELSQDEGSLRQMMEDLKSQGYKSVEEAEKKLKALEKDIERKEDDLSDRSAKIEQAMDEWDSD